MQLSCISCYKLYLCNSVVINKILMIVINQKSDAIGVIASTLCLIHCLATPILFITQSCSVISCSNTPVWWGSLDYIFLVISFFAVHKTTTNTSLKWIKPALWISFLALFIIIINEKIGLFYINESSIYVPVTSLVILHLYNRNHCKCNTNTCCTNK